MYPTPYRSSRNSRWPKSNEIIKYFSLFYFPNPLGPSLLHLSSQPTFPFRPVPFLSSFSRSDILKTVAENQQQTKMTPTNLHLFHKRKAIASCHSSVAKSHASPALTSPSFFFARTTLLSSHYKYLFLLAWMDATSRARTKDYIPTGRIALKVGFWVEFFVKTQLAHCHRPSPIRKSLIPLYKYPFSLPCEGFFWGF